MRSRCEPPIPSFELEVLDGNDIPESWIGQQVGVEIVSSPEITAGWLQSKSAWRLVVVDHRTEEARYIPWIEVEAVSLLEEEPVAQTTHRRQTKRAPLLDRHARPRGISGLRAVPGVAGGGGASGAVACRGSAVGLVRAGTLPGRGVAGASTGGSLKTPPETLLPSVLRSSLWLHFRK